jgi:hypothetical protein
VHYHVVGILELDHKAAPIYQYAYIDHVRTPDPVLPLSFLSLLSCSLMASPVCPYCVKLLKHPSDLFVYLLTDRRYEDNPAGHHSTPYIGISRNPFVRLMAENRKGRHWGRASQLTKAGAGYYRVEAVFGPLKRGAKRFKEVCRREARKVVHRTLRFCDYARDFAAQQPNTRAKLYLRDAAYVLSLYRQREARSRHTGSTPVGTG